MIAHVPSSSAAGWFWLLFWLLFGARWLIAPWLVRRAARRDAERWIELAEDFARLQRELPSEYAEEMERSARDCLQNARKCQDLAYRR